MDDNKVYFEFLGDLRQSGKTNMFGAAPYLASAFGLDLSEARKILVAWMETFDDIVIEGE